MTTTHKIRNNYLWNRHPDCSTLVANAQDINAYVYIPTNQLTGTYLHYATRANCTECMTWLVVTLGANLETRDSKNYTPLMDAVARNHIEATSLLLQWKANPSVAIGRSPLCLATLAKNQIFEMLIDYGAIVYDVHMPWIKKRALGRKHCKEVCVLVLGFQHFHRSTVTFDNGKDVIKIVAQMIWETRFWQAWWPNA